MKVLVTAFMPFNGQPNNYSQEVLKYITSVDKVLLDVIYDQCYDDLSKICNLDDYDLIIALGEARVRGELTLETTAYNAYANKIKDNSGKEVTQARIKDDGPEQINTLVNLDICGQYIKLSHNPGRYVCNNIYYHLLFNYPNKSLFIHIPECHNDEGSYLKYAKTIMDLISNLEVKR